MTPEERRARAFRVQAMLDNGELRAAFDDVKADMVAEWERTFDQAERENIWRGVAALNLVQQKLSSFMAGATDGQMSALRRIK